MIESKEARTLSKQAAALLCLLSLLLGGSLGLWGGSKWYRTDTTPQQARQKARTLTKERGSKLSKRAFWKSCAKDAGPDLYGSFRELDCWITHRRIIQPKGYLLDRKIYKRFKTLYQTLQKEKLTENSPARWKMLYNLGTRLYPRNNRWAASATIPVYEMNGHHHAFRFWLKESFRRKLGPLFHIDSHDDMVAIPNSEQVLKAVQDLKKNRNVKRSWHTIIHTINDCSMPVTAGVLAGLYQRVIWGKSEDVFDFPTFLNRPFFFGLTHKGVPEIDKVPDLTEDEADKLDEKKEEVKARPRRFRLYYDIQNDRGIESFFWNYAWIWLADSQRPVKQKFLLYRPFVYSIVNINKRVNEQGKGEGAKNFQTLLKALPKGKFTLDIDLDYFASVDTTPEFARKLGSDPGLDFKPKIFLDNRKILKERLEDFEDLLLALKKKGRIPSMINLADSTFLSFALDHVATAQSEFTPIEHAAYLRREIRKVLRNVYGRKVYNGRPKHMQNLLKKENITQKAPSSKPSPKPSPKP